MSIELSIEEVMYLYSEQHIGIFLFAEGGGLISFLLHLFPDHLFNLIRKHRNGGDREERWPNRRHDLEEKPNGRGRGVISLWLSANTY